MTKHLTKIFMKLKFVFVSQKSCIIIKKKIFIFYYVDDIMLCFRKQNDLFARNIIESFTSRYIMKMINEIT